MPLLHVWIAFNRMSNRRTSNGYGPNPITWHDIEAYTKLTRAALAPWEVSIIEELDNLYRIEQGKKKE